MATGPGDELTAAGRGYLRASHTDREQVIGTLKAAFVQGRLAKDEFDLRVSLAFVSRTHADLAVVTADLPAGLAAAQPPQPAGEQGTAPVLRPGRVLTVATVLYAGAWPVAFILPRDSESVFALLLLATLVYYFVLLISVGEMVISRIEKRSARQLPQGPAPRAGGQAPPRCHELARAGRFRRPVTGIPPKQRKGVSPAPSLPGSRSLRRWRARRLLAGQRPAITRTAKARDASQEHHFAGRRHEKYCVNRVVAAAPRQGRSRTCYPPSTPPNRLIWTRWSLITY